MFSRTSSCRLSLSRLSLSLRRSLSLSRRRWSRRSLSLSLSDTSTCKRGAGTTGRAAAIAGAAPLFLDAFISAFNLGWQEALVAQAIWEIAAAHDPAAQPIQDPWAVLSRLKAEFLTAGQFVVAAGTPLLAALSLMLITRGLHTAKLGTFAGLPPRESQSQRAAVGGPHNFRNSVAIVANACQQASVLCRGTGTASESAWR